jgi:hypothetical protein
MTNLYEIPRWAQDQRVGNPMRKLILNALSLMANAEGFAYCKQQTLADAAECTRETACRHLKVLAHDGFIKVRPWTRTDGGNGNCQYLLMYRADATWPDGPSDGASYTPVMHASLSPVTNPHSPSDAEVTAPVTHGSRRAVVPVSQHKRPLVRTQSKNQGNDGDERPEAREFDTVSLTRRRLEEFVDKKIADGLGKPEYRDEDLGKPDWFDAIHSLDVRSDKDFASALVQACGRSDAEWVRRFSGPRSAQAFVGEFDRLLPRVHGAQFLGRRR